MTSSARCSPLNPKRSWSLPPSEDDTASRWTTLVPHVKILIIKTNRFLVERNPYFWSAFFSSYHSVNGCALQMQCGITGKSQTRFYVNTSAIYFLILLHGRDANHSLEDQGVMIEREIEVCRSQTVFSKLNQSAIRKTTTTTTTTVVSLLSASSALSSAFRRYLTLCVEVDYDTAQWLHNHRSI